MKTQLLCIGILLAIAGVCTWRTVLDVPRLGEPLPSWCGNCVEVVIAARDIQPGARLEPADVRLEKFPASLVPTGAFEHMSQVVGRSAMFPIDAGEVLLAHKFAAENSAQQKVYEESLLVSECMAMGGTPADCADPDAYQKRIEKQMLDKVDLFNRRATEQYERQTRPPGKQRFHPVPKART